MGKGFVVTRVGGNRFRICYGDYRAECLGQDDAQFRAVLGSLQLNPKDAGFLRDLRETMDLFLVRETRSIEKFGKPRMFRIWRLGRKTLQVDFDGGYAELSDTASTDKALKQCLKELGASDLLLPDLKRELQEFLKDDHPETLPNVVFFRDEEVLKVMIDDAAIHTVAREQDGFVDSLAKQIGTVDTERFLATYHEYRSREERIQKALRKRPS